MIMRFMYQWMVLLGLVVFFYPSQGQALFVSPDRLMIEDGQRSAEVIISNRSNKPVVVRFEWERRAMNDKGGLALVGENEVIPGYQPADPYLRFSPRQVILQPRQHQKVRILVRRTDDLQDGEYHSHFLIKEEPLQTNQETNQPEPVRTGQNKGQLELIVYRSLPVFLRQGDTGINLKLNEAYIYTKDGKRYLHVDLDNESTRSLYATPKLRCITTSGETITQNLISLRIYTEARTIKRDVLVPPEFALPGTCTDLQMDLVDPRDFEFRSKSILKTSISER